MSRGNWNAIIAGSAAAFAVVAGIALGSRGLAHFDAALWGYAVGSILAAAAVAYRFTIWAERPPSRMYFKRGFQLLLRRGLKSTTPPAMELPKALATNFAAQNFIRRRSACIATKAG